MSILCHKDAPVDEALMLMGVRRLSARQLSGSALNRMKLIGRIDGGAIDLEMIEILKDLIVGIMRISQSEFLIAPKSGSSGAGAKELYEMCALAIPRLHRLSHACSIR